MNDRIKELIKSIGIIPEDEHYDVAITVIQECARIARATPCPYTEPEMIKQLGHTWDMAAVQAGNEIMKHFGVE